MDLGLAGRSIVVTGGSSGIGLATARLLLDEGATVTICARDMDRLGAAEADLDSSQLLAVEADVLDAVAAQRVIESAVARAGRLDGVAAVAGRGRHGTLLELDPSVVADEVSDKLLALLKNRSARPRLSAPVRRLDRRADRSHLFRARRCRGRCQCGPSRSRERDPRTGA